MRFTKEDLQEAFREEDLDELAQHRQHAGVVHAHARTQQREEGGHLCELRVLVREYPNCAFIDQFNAGGLVARQEAQSQRATIGRAAVRAVVGRARALAGARRPAHVGGKYFTFTPRKCKDNRRQHVKRRETPKHTHDLGRALLGAIVAVVLWLGGLALRRIRRPRLGARKAAHCTLPLRAVEVIRLILDHVQPIGATRAHVMAERRRACAGLYDVHRLAAQVREPLGDLQRVGHRRREQHDTYRRRQQQQSLLNDPSTISAAEHVRLVEDDPAHLAHNARAPVQHQPQDLRRHHKA